MQLETTMRDYLANAFDDACNAGGTDNGYIVFAEETTAEAALATCEAATTMFNASASGAITLDTGTAVEDTNTSAGDIGNCYIYNGNDEKVASLGCHTTGTPDITVSSLTLGAGETMTVTSLTITVAAGTIDDS